MSRILNEPSMNKRVLVWLTAGLLSSTAAVAQDGPPPGGGHRGPPDFASLDTDGDGKLSYAEVEKNFPPAARDFKQMDTDGDGYVSEAEFKAFRPKRPPGGGQPPSDGGQPPSDGGDSSSN